MNANIHTSTSASLASVLLVLIATACVTGCSGATPAEAASAESDALQKRYGETHRAALVIRNALTEGTNALELRRLVRDLTIELNLTTLRPSATREEENIRALYREVIQLAEDGLYVSGATANGAVALLVRDGIRTWQNNVKTYYYKANPGLDPDLKKIVERHAITDYLLSSDAGRIYNKVTLAVNRAHALLAAHK